MLWLYALATTSLIDVLEANMSLQYEGDRQRICLENILLVFTTSSSLPLNPPSALGKDKKRAWASRPTPSSSTISLSELHLSSRSTSPQGLLGTTSHDHENVTTFISPSSLTSRDMVAFVWFSPLHREYGLINRMKALDRQQRSLFASVNSVPQFGSTNNIVLEAL